MKDDDGFSAMFHRQKKRLTNALRKFGRSAEDAEDILQETMLRAWRGRGDAPPDNEAAYLYTIAWNTAAKQYRDAHAKKRDAELVPIEDDELPHERSAEALAVQRQELARFFARIAAVMDTLPEATRLAIVLRGRGFTGEAIAAALDISHESVRSRLKRANAIFLERLGPPPAGFEWLDLAGESDGYEKEF